MIKQIIEEILLDWNRKCEMYPAMTYKLVLNEADLQQESLYELVVATTENKIPLFKETMKYNKEYKQDMIQNLHMRLLTAMAQAGISNIMGMYENETMVLPDALPEANKVTETLKIGDTNATNRP